MVGIKVKVTLERTLYLDLPDNSTEEDILKAAREEILLPITALDTAKQALKHFHVTIPKLDLKDWRMADYKHEVIK